MGIILQEGISRTESFTGAVSKQQSAGHSGKIRVADTMEAKSGLSRTQYLNLAKDPTPFSLEPWTPLDSSNPAFTSPLHSTLTNSISKVCPGQPENTAFQTV